MRWTLIGQLLFMRQSRSVRHAQWNTATLSCDKGARQSRAIKEQVWHRSNDYAGNKEVHKNDYNNADDYDRIRVANSPGLTRSLRVLKSGLRFLG